MQSDTYSSIRPLSDSMRRMLYVAGLLVFIVGIQLYIFTTMTDRFFAWTVTPPLTAAFLGAAYWSSCVLEVLAARRRTWARARVAVPAVLIFTTLTLVATLLHIDRFHLDLSTFAWYTVALTWVWIAVYAMVPLSMTLLLIQQLRLPGSDAPRQHALPTWMQAVLIFQAAVLLSLGVLLFFVPTTIIEFWPWTLSALTGRTIGAWLIGLGISTAHMAWENAFCRVYPALVSMIVFAILQFGALLRFPADIRWDLPQAWVYVGFLVSILFVGVVGTLRTRQITAEQPAAIATPTR